ncbi:MAG: phosphatase PAP2 family protein [Candidatus Izimaplasma sp.]|nr:phosphatase PAP2 family protein [Candidatus Izimaplasma bacterium]
MGFELDIVRWLQSFRTDFLDFIFKTITLFGEEMIIIIVLGIIYWSINKEIGKRLAITVFLSAGLNSLLKILIVRTRPYLVDDSITNLRPETSGSYSMPSGHTQSASTLFFGVYYFFKKSYLLIFAIIITFLVGLSRMYIGVHYLSDVLVGGLLGIAFVFLFNYYLNKMKNQMKLYHYIGLFSFAILLGLTIYQAIDANTSTGFDAQTFYFNIETIAKMIGALVGFIIGISIETKYINFKNHKFIVKNIFRFVLGIGIVFLSRILLKEFFNLLINHEQLTDEIFLSILAVTFDFLRYTLMVVIGIGLYPYLFKKLNI